MDRVKTIKYKVRDFIPVVGAFLRADRVEDRNNRENIRDRENFRENFPIGYELYHVVSGFLGGCALLGYALERVLHFRSLM